MSYLHLPGRLYEACPRSALPALALLAFICGSLLSACQTAAPPARQTIPASQVSQSHQSLLDEQQHEMLKSDLIQSGAYH